MFVQAASRATDVGHDLCPQKRITGRPAERARTDCLRPEYHLSFAARTVRKGPGITQVAIDPRACNLGGEAEPRGKKVQ